MAGAVGEFSRLASGIYLEGLAVDYRRDIVWYSDVIGGGIHGVKPDGCPVTAFNLDRMWTGGIMMNEDGAVLSSGRGGIMWNNPDTGKSGWLVDSIDGKAINGINEMAPDGQGGLYFGTIDLDNIVIGQEAGPADIYRLTVEGEVIRVAENVGFANGIMHDPVRHRLYCNNTFTCTWGFDVGADLSLSNKALFLDKDDVDGMALDAKGNVWITGFRSSHITRLAPDGTALGPVRTPAGSITQVRFGGADMRDYYITSVPAEGGDTLKEGGELTSADSHLFRGRSEVPGMRIEPAHFRLG